MKNINIKHKNDDNHVTVRKNNSASLTALADDSRDLNDKEFRKLIKLVNEFRKADRHGAGWDKLDDLIGRGRSMTDREWRRSIRLAKTLRKADNELDRAQKLEKRMKDKRFNEAQLLNY